jgi:hypothetical protein
MKVWLKYGWRQLHARHALLMSVMEAAIVTAMLVCWVLIPLTIRGLHLLAWYRDSLGFVVAVTLYFCLVAWMALKQDQLNDNLDRVTAGEEV